MKKALVIFNGIEFPYYLVDHAIQWALKNEATLHGVFIHTDKEPPEGYVFPSDIDPAEKMYDKDDAEKANVNVIHSQVKLFIDMAKGKDVLATTEELTNPHLNDIIKITSSADILLIDEAFDKAYILGVTRFDLKEIKAKSNCRVEVINDDKNKI